ncbi:type VII secretion target [Mycobacterium sp. 155]|uniref:type VII secretion target n=1 Tax=Mycobacterium sp. 155 TaxID=1157943 RepID=UPI0003678E83|nr:type VII secretion target [Mycobacterium sp. 155]
MGEVDAAHVDVGGLLRAARQYDVAAGIITAGVRTRFRFDGAIAGRAHTFSGDALRTALDERAASLRQWARAAGEVAAILRSTTDRYVAADADAAARVG